MKKFTFIVLTLFVNFVHAQTASFGQLTEKGKYETYITSTGDTLNVGDTLKIGQPTAQTNFAYITQGSEYAASRLAGAVVEITELSSFGKKKQGFKMFAGFKGYGLLPVYVDYEAANKAGEIINPNAAITRQQAIEKLKEAKSLMDLEIITESDYEILKKKLLPVITENEY